jgi:hypothetical protein
MKYIFSSCVLLMIGLSACGNDVIDTPATAAPLAQLPAADTSWIADFRALRDALYRHDKAAVKAWFTFPVQSAHNDIWYAVQATGAIANRPFLAADFDKYYDRLFPPRFVKALLKVKTEELYHSGHFETPLLREGKEKFRIIADAGTGGRILQLNYYSEAAVEGMDETSESSVIYRFRISGNRLHFYELRVAG